MKPLVYVAGPITKNPYGCVRQATDAFRWLRELDLVPFLPQLSVLHEMVNPLAYEAWMSYDLDVIRHCHGLVRLPGESPGADREVDYARSLGLPIVSIPILTNPLDSVLVREWADDCRRRTEVAA